MSKLIHLDATFGLSGDMLLGAVSELVDWDRVVRELRKLPTEAWKVEKKVVKRCSITATKVSFYFEETHAHRHLSDIEVLFRNCRWPDAVVERASAIFRVLAEAEAAVHGISPAKVHFHEVGALDSILDIAGFAWAYYLLGEPEVYVSTLPFTEGVTYTQHGLMPVPAPATIRLLEGFEVYKPHKAPRGEVVTPTGAAVIKALGARPGLPKGRLIKATYGAGTRNPSDYPNVLRISLLETETPTQDTEAREIVVIEATVDDMDTRLYPEVIRKLMAKGALDAALVPLVVKKGRPGFLIRVMARPSDLGPLVEVLFQETTTLGVAFSTRERITLARQFVSIEVDGFPIKVKVGHFPDGRIANISPEYEDCTKAAAALGVPVKTVIAHALSQAFDQLNPAGARDQEE
ncbi:MAG: nickel pincer cofactor biosynthesis protein LarC [Firmicutes bacterium]|nr:nickel pincer cofactor biosynthesis protein LarC [Bacillota bacterium]